MSTRVALVEREVCTGENSTGVMSRAHRVIGRGTLRRAHDVLGPVDYIVYAWTTIDPGDHRRRGAMPLVDIQVLEFGFDPIAAGDGVVTLHLEDGRTLECLLTHRTLTATGPLSDFP